MTIEEIKVHLQQFMTDGLMLIVGSGLSCAEGLPGMGQLTADIRDHLDALGSTALVSEWVPIEALISTLGLEGALKRIPPSDVLEEQIKFAVAGSVLNAELPILRDVLAGRRKLPLSELLEWVSFGTAGLPVLTTNYDRLIEAACETSGISVDTLFDGQVAGRLSADRWRICQIEDLNFERGKARPTYRKFARVLKPHGSLDWWLTSNGPVRYHGDLSLPRLMVTPGSAKYRAGYDEPFDTQRSAANAALTSSERLLILGYGFNDDHLEATRLSPQIAGGKPTVLIAMSLTPNAKALLARSPRMTAIEALDPVTGLGTKITHRGQVFSVPDSQFWNLTDFVKEVLRP